MDFTLLAWGGFAVFVFILLAFDLGLLNRNDEEVSIRKSLILCGFYASLAVIFAGGVAYVQGVSKGLEFMTGYVIELSLSLDNVFVIALVFTAFAIPPKYQHRVLFWGILGALVMRAGMILAGITLVQQFHWIIYIFGGFLIFTGLKMLRPDDEAPDPEKIWLVRLARRFFPVTKEFHGHAFFVRINGVRHITPLFLSLMAVEAVDVIFAVDSIPAIFAVTTDPFIVFTSNVFAILGLRSLYFALAGLLPRFAYLKYGLALLLVVIGTKMVLVDIYKLPTWAALSLTAGILIGSIALSLWKTRDQAKATT